MALDMQTALSQYGYVALLAQTNPEIGAKLNQAVAEEWDSARFERELMNTSWYRTLSERRRAIEVQKATDPATWQATLANKGASVKALASRLGIASLPPEFTELALLQEWDDQQIQTYLVDWYGGRDVAGGLTGSLGEAENHIRATWGQYGLDLSEQWVKDAAREVIAGRQTLGGYDNEARSFAKKAYPGFADQLDSGMTMQQIADPFMQTMANTLELSGGAITLKDPSIKRALAGTNGQPMAMWEFERSLKDDARWQSTKQAKNETYSVLQQVGSDWGFL